MNVAARTAATLAALFLLVGFAPSGHATEYAWGNWKCRNFEKAAERHEEARAAAQDAGRHDIQGEYPATEGGWGGVERFFRAAFSRFQSDL